MSNLYSEIYEEVKKIPRGMVSTYLDIAIRIGRPTCARVVGYALGKCKSDIPWHRVINSKGEISFDSMNEQKILLENEGIVFINNKIDLKTYRF